MRRLAIGVVPLLAGLGSAAAGAAPPDAIVFSGICDASAAIALDENRVIVGDDEKPWLSVYRLDGGEAVARVPLPQGGGAGAASGDKRAPEADIEAAAVFGGRIVWMSSNGRNGDGKVDRDRFQLFASHRLANGTWSEAFSRSFTGLPDALAATTDASYEPLRKAVGDLSRSDLDLAPKEHGFNIEGLTATADGRFLLVGLRNPQPDDKAVLFRLDNAEDLLDGRTDKMAFGPVVTLDLGKRGIRDIAWSPAHQAYVIAAGQAKDDKPGAGFALFTWDGTGSPREIEALRGVLDVNPDFHPEAVVPLLERSGDALKPSKRVLIVSDDGTRPLPSGKDCKNKKVSEAEKSFRAVILDVD